MKKLAVFFPGIGYKKDRPLLYYSQKIAEGLGIPCIMLDFGELPKDVKGNREKMLQAAEIALSQARKQLENVEFDDYDEVFFIGKSMGTGVAAKLADCDGIDNAVLILYTPVEATFDYDMNCAGAFIGDKDTWSELDRIKEITNRKNIPLYIYKNCNHSLESENVIDGIDALRDVMEKTGKILKSEETSL